MNRATPLNHIWITAATLLLMAAVVVICFQMTSRFSLDVKAVNRAYKSLEHLDEIHTDITAAEGAQRAHLLTGGNDHLEDLEDAINRLWAGLAQARSELGDEREALARMDRLAASLTNRVAALEQVRAAHSVGGLEAAVQQIETLQSEALMENIRTQIEEFRRTEVAKLEHLISSRADALWLALAAVVAATLIAGLLLCLNAFFANLHQKRREASERSLQDSERRFRAIWDGAWEGMRLLDSEGRILDVNKAFCRFCGMRREELIGQPFTVLYPQPGAELTAEISAYQQRFRDRQIEPQMSSHAIFRSGRGVDLEVTNSFIEFENAPSLLLSIFRDVSARKRTEDALRMTRNRLHDIVAASPAVLYSLQVDGEKLRPTWSSGNIKDILDYDAEETLLPEWWSMCLHPEDAPALADYPRELLEKGRIIHEYRLRHRDGSYRWVRDEKHVVNDADGKPKEVVGSWFDITDRKDADAEREGLIDELKTALSEVKTLHGLLPICAHCKKIRDDKGYWNQVEFFIRDRSEARFSHGVCPECAAKYYPPVKKKRQEA